jgi:NADPH-dependent ferric siderophore reductase
MNSFLPERRIQRVRHELRRRKVEVLRSERLSPGFIRITFGGEDLADFVSLSFDDHIKFIFTNAAGEAVRRDYTPLHYDTTARTLTLDFALHERGAATDWARAAREGDDAVIGGPRGSMIIPANYDWHLLVGDSTAVPAIERRLQELPAGSRAFVVVQLEDSADQRHIESKATVNVCYVKTGEALLAAVRTLPLPEGDGFAWGGGEASTMRPLRELLLKEKGVPSANLRIAAYWKRGASDFHERLEE